MYDICFKVGATMDLQIFRTTLREMLRERKLTLNSLAVQADLSEDTLRSIIYGKSQDIKLSNIIKIANVLNCSLDNLAGRTFYSLKEENIINRLSRLPERTFNVIEFLLQLEEHSTYKKSTSGKDIIQVLLPTGNMKDGMLYDCTLFEKLDISNYPAAIKNHTDLGVKIVSRNYEPVYFPNDILLLSHKRLPEYNDIVLYVDNDGRIYIRKYTENYLMPINGFGKKISIKERKHYKALGVVMKVVKEFNIENYR